MSHTNEEQVPHRCSSGSPTGDGPSIRSAARAFGSRDGDSMSNVSRSESEPRVLEVGRPHRAVSGMAELEHEIEKQLWRWEQRFADLGIAESDKARTLLFFAWQELRDRDRQRTQKVVMPDA